MRALITGAGRGIGRAVDGRLMPRLGGSPKDGVSDQLLQMCHRRPFAAFSRSVTVWPCGADCVNNPSTRLL